MVQYLQIAITGSLQHIGNSYTQQTENDSTAQYNRVLNRLCYNTVMTAKHRSSNVFWRVVAGRIRTSPAGRMRPAGRQFDNPVLPENDKPKKSKDVECNILRLHWRIQTQILEGNQGHELR